MKKAPKTTNNQKIKVKKNSNSSSNNSNPNKKFDRSKLQSLLEDLIKKDEEYDLIIKGLKEKINTAKRENNVLEKEIGQLKSDNNCINKMNKKLNFENNYKTKEIQNKVDFNKSMEKLNNNNIMDKYKEELNKNKILKDKIIDVQLEINAYKSRISELESILNYTNPEIQKQGEEMQKFLSEL